MARNNNGGVAAMAISSNNGMHQHQHGGAVQ